MGDEQRLNNLTRLDARQTNVSTATPIGAIHNHRRPINLLGVRTAEKGGRSAAILAQVEIDVDIWKETKVSKPGYPSQLRNLSNEEKLTRRLRAKRILVVRTQVVDLDEDLVRPGIVWGQFPTDAASSTGAGPGIAAVDGLGNSGVKASTAIPGAGGFAGVVAGAVLSERRRGA